MTVLGLCLPTVTIHVIVTRVPFAVTVGVPLIGILHRATVVTGVTMVVLVTVPLVYVGPQPAVVLWFTGRSE